MVREIRPIEGDHLEELSVRVGGGHSGGEPGPGALAGRRDRSVTFEPQGLSRGRVSPPFIAAGWLVALACLIGVGIVGRSPERTPELAPVTLASPAPQVPLDAAGPLDPINLLEPAIGPITVTSARLSIAGNLRVHAAYVLVSLEARGNRVLDSVSVDTSDPQGGIRPDHAPKFSAEFDIPFPRPNGTMWVVVTAFDSHGIPLGGERRPVQIGEIMGWPPPPGVGDALSVRAPGGRLL